MHKPQSNIGRALGRIATTRAATDKPIAPPESPRSSHHEYLLRSQGNIHRDPLPLVRTFLSSSSPLFLHNAEATIPHELTHTFGHTSNQGPVAGKSQPGLQNKLHTANQVISPTPTNPLTFRVLRRPEGKRPGKEGGRTHHTGFRQTAHGLAQALARGLHLDTDQPRPTERVAAPHRQDGKPLMPLRTSIPRRRPRCLPLPTPACQKRTSPTRGQDLDWPRRPALGHGGRGKRKGAGEDRRHRVLLPGGLLVPKEEGRRGRGGTGMRGGSTNGASISLS